MRATRSGCRSRCRASCSGPENRRGDLDMPHTPIDLKRPPARHPSSGSSVASSADIVIVGGGIMGSAVAMRLAQRGVRVTVIERGIPGAEASSAAAGILGPQMEADGPGPLLELGLRSRALYPALAAELRDATGIDVGYVKSGVLSVALDEAGEGELAARRTWQMARGLRVETLTGALLRTQEPSLGPEVRAGLRFSDDAQVNARDLA